MSDARTRTRRIVAAAVPAAIVGVLIGAYRPILGAIARRKAASLGVELDFDRLELGRSSVRLEGVRATLAGVNGVRITAPAARIGTSGLSITSVDAESVAVSMEGSMAERVLELAAWSSDHADTYRLRGSASDVRIEWRSRRDTPAWLVASGGWITADGRSARFLAANTTAFGVPIGSLGATFAVDTAGVTLEVGKRPNADAPVVATLRTATRPPSLDLTVRPVELSSLGSALGLHLPARGATASGHVELALERTGVDGTASLALDGWVPPHPKTLDGVVTGRKTTLSSHVHVSEDRATVTLQSIDLRAGRLDLKGSGTITEQGDHALVRMNLAGPVACSELAQRMANDELGGVLGSVAGDFARRSVGGTATVSVAIEADSRDLAAASVKPSVGVGCQVKLPGF